LKLASGAAGAEVISAKLLDKLDAPVDDAVAALDPGFGRIRLAALA
jgi:hypothetical protein